MEENKKCCENGMCEKCNTCCPMYKCCMWQKCHLVKYLIWAIVIIVIFCLGAQWGMMKSSIRGYRFDGNKMMNWNTDRFENKIQKTTDSVIVETQLPPQE